MSFDVLKGMRFVASTTDPDDNWLGYKWFEVLGPVGTLTVPTHTPYPRESAYIGEPSELTDQIWIRCAYGVTSLGAFEIYELLRDFVYAPEGSEPIRPPRRAADSLGRKAAP